MTAESPQDAHAVLVRRASNRIRVVRITTIAALIVWLCFLFLQKGCPQDEAEHCHAAWLMQREGQLPLRDFFQHHTRVLWDILSVYFRLGGTGPGVRAFARAIAVLSTTLTVGGLWVFCHRITPSRRSATILTAAASLTLAYVSLSIPETPVARPETISAACSVWSVCVWLGRRATPRARRTRIALDLFAGFLLGIASYASPRAASLCILYPFFLKHPFDRSAFRRYGVLATGAVAAVGSYLLICPTEWSYLSFALPYSTLLQKIGAAPAGISILHNRPLQTATGLVLLLVPVQLCCFVPAARRTAAMASCAALIVLYGSALQSCYPHTFGQNFVHFMIAWLLLCTQQASWLRGATLHRLCFVLPAAAPLIAADAGVLLHRAFTKQISMLDFLQRDTALLSILAPTDTVMLTYADHPITARDASYYGGWLYDAPFRTCIAAEVARKYYPLPPCDFLADLRRMQPFVVDASITMAVHPSQLREVHATLSATHAIGELPSFLSELWVRTSRERSSAGKTDTMGADR